MAHRHKLARMMRGKGGKCYAKGGKVKGEGEGEGGGDEEKQDGEKAEWKEPAMAMGGKAKMKKHLGRPGRKRGGKVGVEKDMDDKVGFKAGGRIAGSAPNALPKRALGGDNEGYGATKKPVQENEGFKAGGAVKHKDFHPGGKKGKLHRELGIAEDKKIPAERLAAAKHSNNPEIKRDAIRADTMKHWHHGKH